MTLIGSNGAGKSTTLRAITGLTPASSGSVVIDGGGHHPGRRPGEIVDRGIALSPEGRHCFARMSGAREPPTSAPTAAAATPMCSPTWSACLSCSRASRNVRSRRQGRCPAVSSRCWRWADALMAQAAAAAARRAVDGDSRRFRSSVIYETIAEVINRARHALSCWSSRTPTAAPSTCLEAGATYLRPVGWFWRASRPVTSAT